MQLSQRPLLSYFFISVLLELKLLYNSFDVFVFFTALQGNNGEGTVTYPQSSLVCTLRGATADLDSTYEYPYDVQYNPTTVKTLWFTKGNKSQHTDLLSDADYTGRVESSCGEVSCTGSRCHGTCTLRIKDLRLTDSATYKFRFTTNHPKGEYPGDPEMTLSVTGKLGLPMSAVCLSVCVCVHL